MKHLSASWWKRAALAAELVGEGDLMDHLRSRLAALSLPSPANPSGLGMALAKAQLAASLGIGEAALSKILRGTHPISEAIAAKLGYRRVVRYESVAIAAPHTNPAAIAKQPEKIS